MEVCLHVYGLDYAVTWKKEMFVDRTKVKVNEGKFNKVEILLLSRQMLDTMSGTIVHNLMIMIWQQLSNKTKINKEHKRIGNPVWCNVTYI